MPVDLDWDDEDEKTTVFDRSSEDSARALLHGTLPPTAKAAPPAASPPPPPPASSAVPVPSAVKTSPTASSRPLAPPPGLLGAPSAPVSRPPPPATSRPPVPPVSQAVAPPISAAAPAPVPVESVPSPIPMSSGVNKNKLVIGGALVAAAGIAAFTVLGGPKTGKLVVTAAGPGGKAVDEVEVLVDGETVCTSIPCILEDLPAGHRAVQVKATGYEAKAARPILIEAGKEHAEDVELSPASSGAGLKVAAEGSGLELYLNGKYVGPLPQELKDLEPGNYTVKISGSSTYAPFEEEVSIQPNKVVELNPKLKLLKGNVTIQLGENARGAEIYFVDGSSKKQITKKTFPLTIEVPADKTYAVIAERKGYEEFEQEVSFDGSSAEQTVTVDLTATGSGSTRPSRSVATRSPARTPAQPAAPAAAAAPSGQATLNINSIPVSNVILNGRPLGPTPKVGVSVPAGSHTVVFIHPDHGRKVRAVTVQAGQTATAAVRFP